MFNTKTFFEDLESYTLKCDSLLRSHYNNLFCLDEIQKILILELYANSIVVHRFVKGLLKGKDIKTMDINKVSIAKEEFARLSEMVKIIMQINLELQVTGLSLKDN